MKITILNLTNSEYQIMEQIDSDNRIGDYFYRGKNIFVQPTFTSEFQIPSLTHSATKIIVILDPSNINSQVLNQIYAFSHINTIVTHFFKPPKLDLVQSLKASYPKMQFSIIPNSLFAKISE